MKESKPERKAEGRRWPIIGRRDRGGRRGGGRGFLGLARAAELLQRRLPRSDGRLRGRLLQRRDAYGERPRARRRCVFEVPRGEVVRSGRRRAVVGARRFRH